MGLSPRQPGRLTRVKSARRREASARARPTCSVRLRAHGIREPRRDRPARLARMPRDDELRSRPEPAVGAPGRERRADPPPRGRGRHHVLRHRRRLQLGPERGHHRPAAWQAVRDARGIRPRDEGARPDDARRERPRAVAQAHHGVDRRVARAPRARLRRPLPDPPLGSDDADRRDDERAARRRQGRQGALHRREQHVRVAVREGAVRCEDDVRVDAEPLQPRLPRGGAGDDPAVHRPGRRSHPLEPARTRSARGHANARRRAADGARAHRRVRRFALHARGGLRRRRPRERRRVGARRPDRAGRARVAPPPPRRHGADRRRDEGRAPRRRPRGRRPVAERRRAGTARRAVRPARDRRTLIRVAFRACGGPVRSTQGAPRMSRKTIAAATACFLLMLAIGVSSATAAPVQLSLPQGQAFAVLGHSCGGIQEQSYATGFDATSGYPTGDVYLSTRCGGSGRGGGYRTTTYTAWAAVTWDFTGSVVSYARLSGGASVNPTFTAYDSHGNEVYNQSGAAYLVLAPGFVPVPRVTSISPTTGPATGGTTVTISGAGFGGATNVSFGSVPAASFTVVSASSITAVSPAAAGGSVDVTVSNAGGASATVAADTFTFVPAPTVTGVSPASGPAAGGTSVDISGTNLGGATQVSFGGTPAGFWVNSDTSLTAIAPAAEEAGTVSVSVTSVGGRSATSAADQFTYVVPPAPVVAGIDPAAGPEAGGTW